MDNLFKQIAMKQIKHIPLLVLCILPLLYLGYIWEDLPNKIPTHWNIKGEIDNWGSKNSAFILSSLPIFTYLMMVIIPKIDPKNKLLQMGSKYTQLKFILVAFMSVLAITILHYTKTQNTEGFKIELLMGLLFMALGNYFQTVKPNYFIGIKTPWTLENETVWKKTHQMGGKLWVAGGILIIIFNLLLPVIYSGYAMATIISVLIIAPIAYSYFEFKKQTS